MRKALYLLLGLVVLVVIATASLPLFLTPARVEQYLIPQLEKATGRTIQVSDQMELHVFPRLVIELHDLCLSNPQGMTPPDMLQARTVSLNLAILPLLHGALKINRFELAGMQLNLIQPISGQPNWVLGAAPTATGEAAGESDEQAAKLSDKPAATTMALPLTNLTLGRIHIEDGAVTYQNRQQGTKHQVTAINANITLPAIDQPLVMAGGLKLDGDALAGDLTLTTPLSLLKGEATQFKTHFSSPYGKAEVRGSTSRRQVAGQTLLSTTFDKLAFSSDQASFDGTLSAQTQLGGSVPAVTFDLNLNQLTVNMPKATTQPAATPAIPAAPAATAVPAATAAAVLWPTTQLDFSALGSANIAGTVGVVHLNVPPFSAGPLQAEVKLENQRLSFNITKLQAFEGLLTGGIVLNNSTTPPSAALKLKMAGFESAPIFSALGQPAQFETTLGATTDVTTTGRSVADFMQHLNGTAQLSMAKTGFSADPLAALSQYFGELGAQAAKYLPPKAVEQIHARTTDISAAVTLNGGVATLAPLTITGPVLVGDGSGTVDLPKQQLNLSLRPKLIFGQESPIGTDVRLPFFVKGTFSAPAIEADTEGLAKEGARQALRQGLKQTIKKNLGDNAAGAIVQQGVVQFMNLLDGDTAGNKAAPTTADGAKPAAQAPSQANPQEDVKKLLNNFKGLWGK